MKKTLICLLLTILFISFAWARGPINDIEPQVMNQARIDAQLHGTTFQVNNRDEDITITVTVDSWASEASWNLWSDTAGAYYWGTDWTFSSGGEVQVQTVSLANGLYSVDCWDTYGDGGIAGIVTDSGGGTLVEWTSGAYNYFGSFPFEVGAVPVEFTVTPAAIDETVAPDANVDVPVTIANIGAIEFDYTTSLSFPIFSFDAQTPTGTICPGEDNQLLGAEFDGTYFWATGGGGTVAAMPNQIYKYDVDGNILAFYPQGTSSSWGMRDMAWDETSGYLYAGDGNGFYQIDPADGSVTTVFSPTGAIGTIRALALLPDGTFWTKSFAGDIYIFDMAGNVINSYVSSVSAYGAAYDPDNNCVWVFEGTTPNTPATTFSQWDIATATFTGVTIAVPLLDGLTAQIIGGAFYHDGIIGGMVQGTDYDTIFEMNLVSDWLAITANGTGTVPIAGSVDVTVNLDATGLVAGEVKEGTLGIVGVAGLSTQETDVPVTMTVEEGGAVYPLPFAETFDTEIPADWSQVIYSGDGIWTWCGDGTPDFIGTDGYYPEADSDENASWVFDVGLFTPAIDCSGETLVTIEFDRNFQDMAGDGEAHLWTYSGGTAPANYEEELWWQTTDDPTGGVHALFEFDPSSYADPANVYLEFWYSTEGGTYAWYFRFDNLDVYGTGAILDPPQNLFVTDEGYATWEAPSTGGDWLFYHDGTFEIGLASAAGGAGIAQMFQPTSYPCTIEQVEYFVNQAGVNGQDIEVWIIAEDGATVLGGPYTTSAVLDWNTIDIDDIVIASGGFMVATYNVLPSGPYIGCDDSTYNGTLYFGSHTGGFTELGVYGYYLMGSHGVYVTYGTDGDTVAKHQVLKPITRENKSYVSDIAVKNVYRDATDRHTRDFLGYNVYLDGGTPPAFTTDLFYQYTGLANGVTYLAEVTALYDEGESDPIDYTFTYVEDVILTLPVFEGFEGGTIPESWSQEYVVGTVDWTYQGGGHSGNPAAAHTGAYNALFYTGNYNEETTQLITPQIDMGTATDVELTFWHTQADWIGDQDILRVYYKNSAGGTWTLLAEYLGDIPAWTEEIITLPDLSDDYYIAFEGFGDYGYGVCVDDISIEGAETLLPPDNVFVDENTWLLTWLPPGGIISSDDFESYTAGEYLAVQSDLWTTWSNAPGTAEDAYISDAQALSGTQSVVVEGTSDLVYIMDDYTSGIYSMEVNLFVPTGYCGYWNLQKTSTPGQEWGFQIMFDVTGIASADAGAAAALTFPFSFDTWINMELVVDLNADWCEIWVDGVMLYEYQWTLGCFGTPGLLQFGGMNLFAWASTGNSPMCYFDDIALRVIEPADGTRETRDLINFNVYLDNMTTPHATVGDDVYEYQYTGLTPLQEYTAGVSAVYDEGESEIIQFIFIAQGIVVLPPENLTADIVTFNDVELNWEAPGGVTGEWIGWDQGVYGNAIGLTEGGEFYVASRWDPAALAPYDGYELTKISFFPHSDVPTTYELMVWTGANAGTLVLTQPVTTFVFDDFNEVDLDTPVTIDASQELWFGYATNHVALEYPAGTDPGPAIAGYGDMITMDGGSNWDSLAGLGLDYNWLLQGYVMGSDGEAIALTPPQRTKNVAPVRNNRNVQLSVAHNTVRINRNVQLSVDHNTVRRTNTAVTDDLRILLGYKVYKDGVEIFYIDDPDILTYTDLGVEPGVREYYVTAVYDEGESIPSNIEIVEIILPIPQNPVATFTYPNVLVTWSPITDSRDHASYNVYRNDMGTTPVGSGITSTMFVDPDLPSGFYIYNITAVYDGGYESEWSEDSNEVEVVGSGNILIPLRTELTGNYPNPFNPVTTIKFALKEDSNVSINIYNIKGALVRTLVDGEMKAAYHTVIWDSKDNTGKQAGSGLYFYKMISEGNNGDYTSTKKMILLK